MLASEIPVAKTPPGGIGRTLPLPILSGCTEPLAPGVPDLRGYWRAINVTVAGEVVAAGHPMLSHVERIEQAGLRLIVTSTPVIHDMVCDGTIEHGVDDVAAANLEQRIQVVATFEDGVHVLRPVGLPGVEVTRRLDGAELVWSYAGTFVCRMARADDPSEV
jgi:hypothetical protein